MNLFFFFFYCSILPTFRALQCAHPGFFIEASRKIPNLKNLIARKSVDSLAQCTKYCSSVKPCRMFNFVQNHTNPFECQLFGGNSSNSDTIISHQSVFGGKICLAEKCLKRNFAYEKFAKRGLANSDFIIKTFSLELEECLKKCEIESDCRAVFHNRQTSLCQISRVSMNSVYNPRLYFTKNENVDMYENNCNNYEMTSTGCTFMRVSGGGITDSSDQILQRISSAEECEQLCLVRSRIADPCRSYTHDNLTSRCYLMWASSRMIGRSPLENMEHHLSHGDLDDCVNFSLKCREENLEVKASSMRMFVGKIMAKKSKKIMCEESFLKGEYEFSSKFDFEKCGILKSNSKDSAYTGVVHVKEGSTNLVTIRDKILKVNCRFHKSFQISQQSLSVSMNVAENNKTNMIMSDKVIMMDSQKPSTPRFTLRILSSNSSEVESVRIGESGWIVLNVKDALDDFTVTNLLAKDINSSKTLKIVNEEGCVIRRDIVKNIERSEDQIKFQINFSGFPKQTEVVYSVIVETCTVGCMPKCNSDLLISTTNRETKQPLSLDLPRHRMVRRAIANEPRHLDLVNDQYEVRGHRLILLNKQPLAIPKLFKKQEDFEHEDVLIVQKSATLQSSFQHCFIDDLSCLFTIILASIQLFLLVSCIIIMYCYFKQYRQIQELNTPMSHHVQYYTYGGSQDKEVSEGVPTDPQTSD